MLEQIRNCRNCELCKNQKPLLDFCYNCDVMWVGLSAKKVENIEEAVPLDEKTQSGKVIAEIEHMLSNVKYYKTNVVKCAPLDKNGKLRYPNRTEMDVCMDNLDSEIVNLQPKVVFLLGEKAKNAVERKYNLRFTKGGELFQYEGVIYEKTHFFAIEHPSYVSIYKRKKMNEYKKAVVESIESVLR